jgi:hypothetical protein
MTSHCKSMPGRTLFLIRALHVPCTQDCQSKKFQLACLWTKLLPSSHLTRGFDQSIKYQYFEDKLVAAFTGNRSQLVAGTEQYSALLKAPSSMSNDTLRMDVAGSLFTSMYRNVKIKGEAAAQPNLEGTGSVSKDVAQQQEGPAVHTCIMSSHLCTCSSDASTKDASTKRSTDGFLSRSCCLVLCWNCSG